MYAKSQMPLPPWQIAETDNQFEEEPDIGAQAYAFQTTKMMITMKDVFSRCENMKSYFS